MMKIAAWLAIFLVLGAPEFLFGLSLPATDSKSANVGLTRTKEEGLKVKQSNTNKQETHAFKESQDSSHSEGSDKEKSESHQKDETKKTTDTREIRIGGSDGILDYSKSKESSGTSKQIDKKHSRSHDQKTVGSKDGPYYRNTESDTEEGSEKTKEESYDKKESSKIKLGPQGISKGKTEKSETNKSKETNEQFKHRKTSDEEICREGGKAVHKKSNSASDKESKSARSSEIHQQSSSTGDGQKENNSSPTNVGDISKSLGESKKRKKRHTNNQASNNQNEHSYHDSYESAEHKRSNNEQYRSKNKNYGSQEINEQRTHQSINIKHGSEKENYRSLNSNYHSELENNGTINDNHRARDKQINYESRNVQNGSENRKYISENANRYSTNDNNRVNSDYYRARDVKQMNQYSDEYGPRNVNYRSRSSDQHTASTRRSSYRSNSEENSRRLRYGPNNKLYRSSNNNRFASNTRNGNSRTRSGHYRFGNINNYYGSNGSINKGSNNKILRPAFRNQYAENSGTGNYRSNSNRRNLNNYYAGYGRGNYETRNYGTNNRNINNVVSGRRYINNSVSGRRNLNYGFGQQRDDNSKYNRKNEYNNGFYRNSNRRYGNKYKAFYGSNNIYTHSKPQSTINGNRNDYFQARNDQYRNGVKHVDVLKFLSNKGHRISNRRQDGYYNDHGYSRGQAANNYDRAINRNTGYRRGILGGYDFHRSVDDIRYTTGNGRYVIIPVKDDNEHRYYDKMTGNYHDIRQIHLHNGEIVNIPGKYIGNKDNKEISDAGHGYSGKNPQKSGFLNIYGSFPYNLGSNLFYCGDGTYKYNDETISCNDIVEFCKSHNINTKFTDDGFPECLFNDNILDRHHGKLPLDLGQNLTFIGYGHYRYNNKIIPATNIFKLILKLKLKVSITHDGIPLDLLDDILGDTANEHEYLGTHENELLEIYGNYPYDLGSDLFYCGNGTYKYKDEIVPNSDILKFCKSHNINIKFTDDGFPDCLFNENITGITVLHEKLPIDFGQNLSFIGHGHYRYKNKIIPTCDISELINKLKLKIAIRRDGIPSDLIDEVLGDRLNENEHNIRAYDTELLSIYGNYPYDLGFDLFYCGDSTYKYKNETISNNNIVEFCKSHHINTNFTDDGFPLCLFNENENSLTGANEKFPIDLGENLSFIGYGHYRHKNKIIPACNIFDLLNKLKLEVSIRHDGIPSDLIDETLENALNENEHFASHEHELLNTYGSYPYDLGFNVSYYGDGTYKYKDKTILCSDIIEFCKSRNINIKFTDDGFPDVLFNDSERDLIGPNGKFPIYLGSNLYFIGFSHYKYNNRIIPAINITALIEKLKLDISIRADLIPSVVFDGQENVIESNENEPFPYYLGDSLYYDGNSSYKYHEEIISSSNIVEYCKSHKINISFTDDGIPDLTDDTEEYEQSSDYASIDLGSGLIYTNDGMYKYHDEIIPANKIVEFCKDRNINNISFTEDGYPKLDNDEPPPTLHQPSNCPKGPIDLGEDITYVGDCYYEYQDHLIPSKYILELLNILQIYNIRLPVGPHDDFSDNGRKNSTLSSKEDYVLDLGFGIYYMGNRIYKYKDRYIPATYYIDVLDILGLKIQHDKHEKLVKDNSKFEKSEKEILYLIDKLLNSKNHDDNNCDETTDLQATTPISDNTCQGNCSDSKNDSSNNDGTRDKPQSHNPEGLNKPVKYGGSSSPSSASSSEYDSSSSDSSTSSSSSSSHNIVSSSSTSDSSSSSGNYNSSSNCASTYSKGDEKSKSHFEEHVEKSEEQTASKKSSSSKESNETKETDCENNTKSKTSSLSSEHENKKESSLNSSSNANDGSYDERHSSNDLETSCVNSTETKYDNKSESVSKKQVKSEEHAALKTSSISKESEETKETDSDSNTTLENKKESSEEDYESDGNEDKTIS